MNNNILELKNVTKKYDNFMLNNISFSLEKGYIMGFIGPNGSGKTTTIKLIMNLIKRDAGEIKVFGRDNIKDEVSIKQKIGFVYDTNYFYEELTLEEMKSIIAPFYKKWSDETFYRYAKLFNLPLKQKIKTLSKGMQMKYSLALALSHDAQLILMDEPTSGLDPVFRNELLEILSEHIQDEHKAILFSTHITSDLEKTADFITFINNGEIVFSQPKDYVLENYALVKGSNELLDADTKKAFVGIKRTSFGFKALTNKTDTVKQLFKDKVVMEKATLDDIIFYTVKGEKR